MPLTTAFRLTRFLAATAIVVLLPEPATAQANWRIEATGVDCLIGVDDLPISCNATALAYRPSDGEIYACNAFVSFARELGTPTVTCFAPTHPVPGPIAIGAGLQNAEVPGLITYRAEIYWVIGSTIESLRACRGFRIPQCSGPPMIGD